ncbi:hypothetical protein Clacol_005629 [Clathrus columnatus]|uniref:Arginine biosynthesis bifunctional protein ArgJ, mitochondrial n=1 Tax=Clathrus columnatus TaxID=1419009 RepID=A0AAV5AEI4_9AGAM|nr:hypothetical protein Clacol_005629 [Clathrus columnatus]
MHLPSRSLTRLGMTLPVRHSSSVTNPSKARHVIPIHQHSLPKEFVATGVHCGIKKKATVLDLGLVLSTAPIAQTSSAACFTRNAFKAAPVTVSANVLEQSKGRARALVLNSGCANAVTGKQGISDAWAMSKATDKLLKSEESSFPSTMVMSTGVIGQNLPIAKILAGIESASSSLGSTPDHWNRLAQAFMTTDTFPKIRARAVDIAGTNVRIVGIDKGAGMIHPNMGPAPAMLPLHATLLGLLATDAKISPSSLQNALTYAVERSFNSISVDGDMSTNDTIIALANGAAGGVEIDEHRTPNEFKQFRDELTKFAVELAQLVVRDGEGATKFVTVSIKGASSFEDAHRVASTISTSALVKTALFGEDANWGRILAALGRVPLSAPIDPTRVSVSFVPLDGSEPLRLLVNGEPQNMDEARAKTIISEEDVEILVEMGMGNEEANYWTCDFSHLRSRDIDHVIHLSASLNHYSQQCGQLRIHFLPTTVMSESDIPFLLHITYKGVNHDISILSSETLESLQDHIYEKTAVPPSFQKLLYKGKKGDIDTPISEAGLQNGTKVMLLGSTEQDVGLMKATEAEKKRKDEVLKQRGLKRTAGVRNTYKPQISSYRFHRLEPLRHLPRPETALSLLKRLSEDPAILHVMQLHKFSVGLLTELAPHEHPHLLGLNENAGQAIKLRIRTDAYDGFRLYSEVRRVLCHELTHNVWGNHDDNFKTLNSQLNREVAEYERTLALNTHSLGGETAAFVHEIEAEAEGVIGGSYVLGGGTVSDALTSESRDERRRRILEATASRLQQEEKQIEDMCGMMAPKGNIASPRKTSRQTRISFKPTKRDAAPIKAKAKAKSKSKSTTKPPSDSESSSETESLEINREQQQVTTTDVLDVHDKIGKYKRYYKETRELTNKKAPNQPKVYQMLRVFDNTYDFGPCVGMTRLERWQRAQALGLNPPNEVREILLTEQGRTDPELVHPVFYGQVL